MDQRKYLELDKDEEILLEVKRHRIGLIPIYFFGGLITLIFLAMAFGLPLIGELSEVVDSSIFYIVFFLLSALAIVVTYIAAKVYKTNELVLTNESLVQLLQRSLFSRSISQLSLSSVQDVTVDQPNFLSNLFNYGTIIIETAGEQANFIFQYAKDPFVASEKIIEAAESWEEKHGVKRV